MTQVTISTSDLFKLTEIVQDVSGGDTEILILCKELNMAAELAESIETTEALKEREK